MQRHKTFVTAVKSCRDKTMTIILEADGIRMAFSIDSTVNYSVHHSLSYIFTALNRRDKYFHIIIIVIIIIKTIENQYTRHSVIDTNTLAYVNTNTHAKLKVMLSK